MRQRLAGVVGALGHLWFLSRGFRENDGDWRVVFSMPSVFVLLFLLHALKPMAGIRGLLLTISFFLILMFLSPATTVSMGDRAVFVTFYAVVAFLLSTSRVQTQPLARPRPSR